MLSPLVRNLLFKIEQNMTTDGRVMP